MPGVWLGENEIPSTVERSSGVYEFSLYRETELRPRLIAFSLFFGFASLLCIPTIVVTFGRWHIFSLVLVFYAGAGIFLFLHSFGHSEYEIDTNSKTIKRSYYVLRRQVTRRVRTITKNDRFVVYILWNYRVPGAHHLVYANIGGVDRYFVDIHLPIISRSDELIQWLDAFAELLEIRPAKYNTLWTYYARLYTFRSRSL